MAVKLSLKTYKQEGDMAHEYNPLRNIIDENNNIRDFDTDELNIDLNNPLNIECQPSYDGTVNLILNDDKNPPRIINTRFSKMEDDRYKVISRDQLEQTNLYRVGSIDQQTRLFRNINKIPKIDLLNVSNAGQLKGGNYTFYIKLADSDTNKTDIVAESGQVTVYKGSSAKISSISGALYNELTDKAISLKITNIDTTFSKLYLYYSREFSDTNGIRMSEAAMITKPYDIKGDSLLINVNGYEDINQISIEDLNIQYNIVSAAKTQAQVQNMLFLGNVQQSIFNLKELQNISYYIDVTMCKGENIGWISQENYSIQENSDITQAEYYSPTNIYYRLGYWPDEIYRLGVVYIMNDDSLSPVFNLRGCEFKSVYDESKTANNNNLVGRSMNTLYKDDKIQYLDRNTFINGGRYLDNSFGVFKTPFVSVINYSELPKDNKVTPLYFKFEFPDEVIKELKKYKVKGYFIVRQKRIPTIVAQGLSIGVDNSSYIPMIKHGEQFETEGFLTKNRLLSQTFEDRIKSTDVKECSGLLCLDAAVNKTLQSLFDGSDFMLQPTGISEGTVNRKNRHYWLSDLSQSTENRIHINSPVVFVNSDVPYKYINGFSFSTRCGSGEDVSQFSFFGGISYAEDNDRLLRGIYCPFLGVGGSLIDNNIYNIKIPNYSTAKMKEYFQIRGNDTSPFFAISDRYSLDNKNVDAYRGDCYTNTVTIRLNRNFIDSDVPVNEHILDNNTWKNNYKGYSQMKKTSTSDEKDNDSYGSYENINRADLNTVNLGTWVTYKCLSNYNLGLRSEDPTHIDEYALMGNARSFYPFSDMTPVVSHKTEESWLLNDGYSATVGCKREFAAPEVPYVQELFDNRVMFSDVQANGDIKNAYRIFQGLDYKDIDRQYGAIVKLLPMNNNIFCVFEHGLGLLPINEKALLATQSGQSIHMYGAGVLQNQISLISPDFGSTWSESIIRTPIGIYGVDTYAKKIWVYSSDGLKTISDMKVQRFLNDNITLKEQDKYPTIGLKNVKSHYNNFKGDVMFTFYNDDEGTTWNLCYNERMGKWITRYSWTPLYSENINNVFYSLDRDRAKILSYIYNNKHCTFGVRTDNNQFKVENETSKFSTNLEYKGYDLVSTFTPEITSIETSYLKGDIEEFITITDDINKLFFISKNQLPSGSYETLLESKPYETLLEYFNTKYKIDYVPVYFKINVEVGMDITDDNQNDSNSYFTDTIGIVLEYRDGIIDDKIRKGLENKFLRNGFYVHGKAGIFNELNYNDDDFDNQILPTKWYDRQEPFEFEFVVNDQVGAHKIFNNLVIISNNVQPNELEFEIEGDVFNFNKAGIFRDAKWPGNGYLWNEKYNKPTKTIDPTGKEVSYQTTQEFVSPDKNNQNKCRVEWDTNTNSYSLVLTQSCRNISDPKYGRRLGNIQYKEDSWYTNIEPIIYKERFKIGDKEEVIFREGKEKSARIRDKYMKVRVKYTGEDLVIITALKTLYTLSYA